MSDVAVEAFSGQAIVPFIPALAALRIAVFREYPYLYDGTEAYEAEYLASYAASDDALVVIARDGDHVVGASTALPLLDHGEALGEALTAHGLDPSKVYYFGESVLDGAYRGRGIGHAFFDAREAKARALGRFTHTAFCAVDRPADHPRRPPGYAPHDVFWTKRGYVRQPAMKAKMAWKELDGDGEVAQTLTYWLRAI